MIIGRGREGVNARAACRPPGRASAADDASEREDADRGRPGGAEGLGCGVGRRARGEDVVDEEQAPPADLRGSWDREAFRTLARRAAASRSVWGGVGRVRTRARPSTGRRQRAAHGAARSSAWLNPRSASRAGCSGTGTRPSAHSAGGAGTTPGAASARRRPSGAATTGRPPYFSAWIASRIPSR